MGFDPAEINLGFGVPTVEAKNGAGDVGNEGKGQGRWRQTPPHQDYRKKNEIRVSGIVRKEGESLHCCQMRET